LIKSFVSCLKHNKLKNLELKDIAFQVAPFKFQAKARDQGSLEDLTFDQLIDLFD